MMVPNIEGLAGYTKRDGHSCEIFTHGVRNFKATVLTIILHASWRIFYLLASSVHAQTINAG